MSDKATPAMKRRYESALKELETTKARLHTMISLNADLQLDKVRLERALNDIMQTKRDRK